MVVLTIATNGDFSVVIIVLPQPPSGFPNIRDKLIDIAIIGGTDNGQCSQKHQ